MIVLDSNPLNKVRSYEIHEPQIKRKLKKKKQEIKEIKRKGIPLNRMPTNNYRRNDRVRKPSMDPKTTTCRFDEEQDIYRISMCLPQISYELKKTNVIVQQ